MARENILIVDDNRVNGRIAEALLSKAGYQVRLAADASETQQAIEDFHPRMILMDVCLGDADGLELTRKLREDPAAKDSLIIAFSANNTPEDEEKAKSAGCNGYIVKPIDPATFADQVRRHLEPEGAALVVEAAAVPVELRKEFITEGCEQSRAWAAADRASLNLEEVRRAVHNWVGIGGTLGYPEITARGRELEAMLESMPENADFQEIADLFAAVLAAGFEEAAPAAKVPAVQKKAGVFAFEPNEYARIHGALELLNVASADLGMLTEGLSAEFFAAHDLIVLNACIESGRRAWASLFKAAKFGVPVLMVVPLAELVNLGELDRARPADFVFAPWDPEEISFRAKRILRGATSERERTVLIADDDPMVHSLLKPALAKFHLGCLSVRDGRGALDAIKNSSPDAAILDIGMPRISGLTVLTEIRKSAQTKGLPILMLTARQQRSEVTAALGSGANDYVVKPFDADAVVARLLRLMA